MSATRFEVLREQKYRALADLFRDDALSDGFSLYYHDGIIDSNVLKKNIQDAIVECSRNGTMFIYLKPLREFLTYVIRTGERGPIEGWKRVPASS